MKPVTHISLRRHFRNNDKTSRNAPHVTSMGFLGSVCRLVGALTILCELPTFQKPAATVVDLNNGLKGYFPVFKDDDPMSGASLNLMGNGIPLVFQPLFAYLLCMGVPAVIVTVLILTGRDQSEKWNLRPKPSKS
ncbi:hypothetical protein BC830DRAFT_1218803 [Chytriomyces sp. MP71]|nr:hypothetical protein BC830DRAFT_1218803 [Chytriomyces sp. MP71]